MRVVAGSARGRRLEVPRAGTRPTSDRAREGIFSTLESLLGSWSGVRVLDLYAGSGALAIEALSRGAAAATLVDSAAGAVEVIRRNLAATGVAGATVVRAAVERFVREPVGGPWDLVLADPPYELAGERIEAVLASLRPALAGGAIVAVERSRRSAPPAWPQGYAPVKDRAYGEAVLWYGRAS